jgi:type VI protein secretion system component Hcp
MYLQVPGATGEVVDKNYVGAIQIFSQSWGVSTDPSSGKANLSSLSVQGLYDKAEPALEGDVEKNTTIPTVTLTEVDSTGKKIRTTVLTNAHLDSVSIGSSLGGGAASLSLSLSFVQRQVTYYYQDAGGHTHTTSSCWNIANQATCTG